MIGATAEVIAKAEQRDQFKEAMENVGLEVRRSRTVTSLEEAREVLQDIGLPRVLRPSFTLGGTGSSGAYNREQFDRLMLHGLDASPIHQVLIEESVLGWKEFEMEVMRDADEGMNPGDRHQVFLTLQRNAWPLTDARWACPGPGNHRAPFGSPCPWRPIPRRAGR